MDNKAIKQERLSKTKDIIEQLKSGGHFFDLLKEHNLDDALLAVRHAAREQHDGVNQSLLQSFEQLDDAQRQEYVWACFEHLTSVRGQIQYISFWFEHVINHCSDDFLNEHMIEHMGVLARNGQTPSIDLVLASFSHEGWMKNHQQFLFNSLFDNTWDDFRVHQYLGEPSMRTHIQDHQWSKGQQHMIAKLDNVLSKWSGVGRKEFNALVSIVDQKGLEELNAVVSRNVLKWCTSAHYGYQSQAERHPAHVVAHAVKYADGDFWVGVFDSLEHHLNSPYSWDKYRVDFLVPILKRGSQQPIHPEFARLFLEKTPPLREKLINAYKNGDAQQFLDLTFIKMEQEVLKQATHDEGSISRKRKI